MASAASRSAVSSPSLASELGIGGHEGGREGALGEDAAEQVGEGQRRVPGVGGDAPARRPGWAVKHRVAGEAPGAG